jgi:predicted DNA-binding transcriptional regulator AlpA
MSTTTDLLSTDEVMRELRISRGTYWKYLREYPRQFKTSVMGRRRYMRRETLLKFVEFRERQEAQGA